MKLENLSQAAIIAARLQANRKGLQSLPQACLAFKGGLIEGGSDDELAAAGAKGMMDAIAAVLERRVEAAEAELAELGVEVEPATPKPTTAERIQDLLDHALCLKPKDFLDLERAKLLASGGSVLGEVQAAHLLAMVIKRHSERLARR